MSDCITVTLTRENEVIDLEDFAALFTGIGSQFDDYLKAEYPEVHGHAQMGIRELRHGCIIFELAAVMLPEIINRMDEALILYGFIQLVKGKVSQLGKGQFLKGARKAELKDVTDMVQAIARDKNANAELEYKERDKNGTVRKEITLNISTQEARRVVETAERQKVELDKTGDADYARVFMYLTRAGVEGARLAHRSGDRGVIEAISPKPRSIMYQSVVRRAILTPSIKQLQ